MVPGSLEAGSIAVLVAGVATGGLIGAVGVGGVLIAPLLVLLAGYEPHLAVATASWSFLFTGIVGAIAYARRGNLDGRAAVRVVATVVPAAVVGAWTNAHASSFALTVLLCLLVTTSGLRELLAPTPSVARAKPMPSGPILAGLGAVAGFVSALTGTGGPVVLVPLLLLLRVPALAAVGLSQVVQLPVAVFASLGYGLFGRIDIPMGTALGLTQAVGVLLGARLAHTLPSRRLGQVVAFALLGTAALLLTRMG
ncbi:MAG: sulfite exporter TauE/SafE family protein [Trueperaceae bacterium]